MIFTNLLKTKRPFCFFVCFVLCFSFLPVVNASASSVLSDQEYYAYWYADNYCGVDWSQYSSTDDGSTIEDYTQRKGQKSFSQAIEDVAGEVQTAADTTYTRVYDAAKETVSKAYTTTAKAAEYVAEKANRTLETAAGTAYSVAGGSFWSSVFNDLFNNDGYKEQYVTPNNGQYNVNTSIGEINISFYGYTIGWGNHGNAGIFYGYNNIIYPNGYGIGQNYNSFYTQPDLSSTNYNDCTDYFDCWYKVTYNDQNGFLRTYSGGSPSPQWAQILSDISVSFIDGNNYVVIKIGTGENWYELTIYATIENVENGSNPVLQPSQVGFIRLPNGDIVPVYTDKTKNDFDINDNGTVTLPNGDVVPIYIYPDELNPVGQTQILKFINTMPFQLPFGTNDSLPISSDGEGGSFLEGLGQLIGDIFSGLLEGLGEVLEAIANAIKDFFGFFKKIISDLFGGGLFEAFGNWNLNSIFHFDKLEELIYLFFELTGIEIV